MQSLPRALSGLGRSNAAWTCSSCSKAGRQSPKTPFFNPSMRARKISNSSKPRGNAAPTMEQLREPFHKKNTSTLYYTISIIMGTVALSYGSVPMYKMVCFLPLSWSRAIADDSCSRSARQPVGVVNPSKLPATAVPLAAIRPSGSNPSPRPSAYELHSMGQCRTYSRGNSRRSSARSRCSQARRRWRSTRRRTRATRISSG